MVVVYLPSLEFNTRIQLIIFTMTTFSLEASNLCPRAHGSPLILYKKRGENRGKTTQHACCRCTHPLFVFLRCALTVPPYHEAISRGQYWSQNEYGKKSVPRRSGYMLRKSDSFLLSRSHSSRFLFSLPVSHSLCRYRSGIPRARRS